MKYRRLSPIILTLGLATLLSGCPGPSSGPTSTPAPGGAQTPATAVSPATPAAATPASDVSPSASPGEPAASATPAATPGASGGIPDVPGVKISIHKPGSGEPLASGVKGRFHYTGWLEGYESANKFDSSKDRNQPFEVTLGQGMVIPGWDQGLIGMLPGETRRLEIAPEMAYGANGAPPAIPPNATLFFEVDYLGPVQ
jgi:hypothetical protein